MKGVSLSASSAFKLFQISLRLRSQSLKSVNFDVFPNFINVKNIKELGGEPCNMMDDFKGLKILTVGRLSTEKNPLVIPEIASQLLSRGQDFKWFVVGAGGLFEQLQLAIKEKGVEDKVVLCGGQLNPYKFMSRCDVYAQFSKFEADPITIKEVAVFNKLMVLSDIIAFNKAKERINNICSSNKIDEIVNAIILAKEVAVVKNDLIEINCLFQEKMREIFV